MSTLIEDLENNVNSLDFSLACKVCAFAQLAERSDETLRQHVAQILSFLERSLQLQFFLLRTLSASASVAGDFAELIAKAGDGAFACRLEEEHLPELRSYADNEEELLVVQLVEDALERLRTRLTLRQ
eukprot:TRINITY_DN11079_c0_g1_i1.p1 TRINITY_DN11079_c0_g1~~TRINITY_DN11079_c0_g1_i1.p1  ORF type:complete len:128 (+),score=39.70 TRINITY_DN11079_c0_g1_i1:550-933(+)